jgi:predicted nucleic acid-binding protein
VSLVLDSSVTLAWCFKDEKTPAINSLMRRIASDGAVVPGLWLLEVANGLQVAIRRKRIDGAHRVDVLTTLAALDFRIDAECDTHAWSATLQLADLYRLTAYDACYLELAQRRRLPLATLDGDLAQAARQAGVPVVP